jgi:hypothetical protein
VRYSAVPINYLENPHPVLSLRANDLGLDATQLYATIEAEGLCGDCVSFEVCFLGIQILLGMTCRADDCAKRSHARSGAQQAKAFARMRHRGGGERGVDSVRNDTSENSAPSQGKGA